MNAFPLCFIDVYMFKCVQKFLNKLFLRKTKFFREKRNACILRNFRENVIRS